MVIVNRTDLTILFFAGFVVGLLIRIFVVDPRLRQRNAEATTARDEWLYGERPA